MAIALTWLSHASWLIEVDSHRILLDPFFTDNPAAQTTADSWDSISHVLVSHGHFDHVKDVEAIARRNACPIVCNFEISQWYGDKGFGSGDLPAPIGMNIGGQIELPFGKLKMVPAVHSSTLPDGSPGGTAAGFVLTTGSRSLYFACDTAFFSDMKHYAYGVDVAVLPIGDLYTMGVEDCLHAIQTIEPLAVLPTHYGTWPPIAQDPKTWAEQVRENTSAKPIVLGIGERYEI
ncbi:L-ascorbate metabolism protein UlaG, beta-lactamase superfamily [Neorhodopirellula lusitana]|uniref:L-ascorbate metabolism protein UlaG, beta-lactamase superfamily n=1 Tax=Neorhodopirellula lusitana TaxID=445327 RepID=A0ABY1QGR5_9BACT|nr:metal-dependent hydrolase [Neorhodopirellula lusitana]SMP70805.1 L-ascorbate metabolism protein UlaG, beta-lactamase superfamily [Neorhodopirellula lusitana]